MPNNSDRIINVTPIKLVSEDFVVGAWVDLRVGQMSFGGRILEVQKENQFVRISLAFSNIPMEEGKPI